MIDAASQPAETPQFPNSAFFHLKTERTLGSTETGAKTSILACWQMTQALARSEYASEPPRVIARHSARSVESAARAPSSRGLPTPVLGHNRSGYSRNSLGAPLRQSPNKRIRTTIASCSGRRKFLMRHQPCRGSLCFLPGQTNPAASSLVHPRVQLPAYLSSATSMRNSGSCHDAIFNGR